MLPESIQSKPGEKDHTTFLGHFLTPKQYIALAILSCFGAFIVMPLILLLVPFFVFRASKVASETDPETGVPYDIKYVRFVVLLKWFLLFLFCAVFLWFIILGLAFSGIS